MNTKTLAACLREVIEKEPRIGHVNGDHLWYGMDRGHRAALNDNDSGSDDDNYAVAVLKRDEFDRLQKLALLLPECVEALEKLNGLNNEYLQKGGLFNPELMHLEGEKLRLTLAIAPTTLARIETLVREMEGE